MRRLQHGHIILVPKIIWHEDVQKYERPLANGTVRHIGSVQAFRNPRLQDTF
jgi:hypothetical protein